MDLAEGLTLHKDVGQIHKLDWRKVLLWTELCVSKMHMLKPNPQCDRIWSKEVKFNEVIWVESYSSRISALIRRNLRAALSLC